VLERSPARGARYGIVHPRTVHSRRMATTNPVAYETRIRPRQGVLAGVGGIALLAAAALQASGPQPKVSELTVELITYSRREGLVIAGAILNGIGLVALALTIVFLLAATRARRPGMSQGSRYTALVGGVLGAIGGIAYGIEITSKAHDFVTHGTQTYLQANSLVGGGPLAALQYAGLLGSLLLAIAFVLVSLGAMRVGLLTRFLGYLGIVAAAASILLIESLPAQVIQIFWLMAVAYLLIGRWPNGDPPAWRTGEAEPWPTAAQLREQREQAGGARNGKTRPPAKRGAEPAREPVAVAPAMTRANTPKRKRKRRK
jgi:hypothetical protein